MMPTEQPDWVDRHLNQDFPPRLPEGWVHRMPFAISTQHPDRRTQVDIVAGVKSLDLPPYYFVETRDPSCGRVYLDAEGARHIGISPFKHPDPPGFFDFEEAVRVAESYLDGTLPYGPVVERGPDSVTSR